MNSVFSEQILADKLSKLNSTQQCIETLSHWCIFHRSKAEVVVATWNAQFHKSKMAQKIPLLYLANDILQNSKRKGNEFVTEFWKVLPAALKDLNENGDEQGKKVVSRLVNIWEERKVFGSRAQNLKDLMLGAETLPPLQFSKKRSRSVKIVKRDSRSIRTKLSIGGSAEKIVSAFHLVLSEQTTEDAEMDRCKSAVNRVRKMEHDVDTACARVKDPKRKTLAKELEEEENILKECVEKLKSVEANRVALVSQLREALQEQESELEIIRTQMQVAQAQADEATVMRKRLCDENYVAPPTTPGNHAGQKSQKTAADIAAEVADKLAASSSSQFIMTSVLSTFAAEEAKNAGLVTTTTTSASNSVPPNPMTPNHISKLEQQPLSAQPPPTTPAHQYQSMVINQPALQTPSPSAQTQYQQLLPNTASSQQYAQTSRGVTPFGNYGSFAPLPPGPPPPPPPHVMNPMMPMAQTQMQMNQQQLLPLMQQQQPMLAMQQQQQQPPAPPSFRPLQPPGMMYFTQPHHNQ